MSLIEQLKNEHEAIRRGLEKAYHLQSEPEQAQQVFAEVKGVLLQHLDREDRELYPVLEHHSRTDPKLKELLDEYQTEMKSVSETALAFLAAVEAEELEGFRFAREFGNLSTVLANRIRREEAKLYPAFEQLGV